MIFEYENYIYKLEPKDGESEKFLNTKGWFIVKQKMCEEDLEYLENIAEIYANIKINNCIYSKEILDEVNEYGKNIDNFQPV